MAAKERTKQNHLPAPLGVCSWVAQIKLTNPGAPEVVQSVERPTSAQVMISHSVSSSPTLGSVLTAQSLEPASDSVSPSLSAPPLLNEEAESDKQQGVRGIGAEKHGDRTSDLIDHFLGSIPMEEDEEEKKENVSLHLLTRL